MAKEIMNANEACEFLGIRKSRLYRLTSEKIIPHYKPDGQLLLFNRDDLLKWLERSKIETGEEIEERAQKQCLTRSRNARN